MVPNSSLAPKPMRPSGYTSLKTHVKGFSQMATWKGPMALPANRPPPITR